MLLVWKLAHSHMSLYYHFDYYYDYHFRQGAHPDATGIPLTLAWDAEDSQEFDLDEFESTHSHKGELRKIAKTKRERIAQQHHSRSSITELQQEMRQIRQFREQGKMENARKAELQESKKLQQKKKSLFGRFRKQRGEA
mmetsp:Transcript_9363/g.21107  ORF Transcript_9363/g.21107 Transcript_9363/m.21107 type:complete len:139 (+) Transcript_9363:431-847(+)